jgi:hypothetical protein
MYSATVNIDPLVAICWDSISAMGWCEPNLSLNATSALQTIQQKLCDERCIFRALLSLDRENESSLKLTGSSRSFLQQLTPTGLSLLIRWPREQGRAVDEWLGRRFYFSASTNFSAKERYVSLVSSQLGRHGSKIPSWPTIVDAALQNARRDRERPLILPGTSLSEATQQFSNRADLNSLQVELDGRSTIKSWLNDLLKELELAYAGSSIEATAQQALTSLRLSPPALQPTAPEIASLPLQDRVAIALADRVMVIHVRSNGKIASLAERRLADNRFPIGSVYIASMFGQPSSRQRELDIWLERGAVGWLLLEPTRQSDHVFSNCRKEVSRPFTQSLCTRMSAHWTADSLDADSLDIEWPYLAHCTRGNSGPLPDETLAQFRDRAWRVGVIPDSHPLSTLQQILNDQRIRGNSRLTRTQQPCVSFSEVPLAELLSRRQFRSHLGRWDWEPYGILVRREALKRLGARPVIYGDEADYKQLADQDKPYFQPRGIKNTRNDQDWSSEREWRLLGDMDFLEIDQESIVVFVATQTEAQQVARRCQWTVLWKDN